MAVAHDGGHAYVSVDGISAVKVINVASDTVMATVPGFNVPNWLTVTPDSRYVYVVNNGGDAVSVFRSAPGMVPDQGPIGGGTTVTITGRYVTGATAVKFGSQAARSFTVVDDNTITAVTPSGTGAVWVTVTAPGGTGVLGHFYYIPPPRLTSLSPTDGPVGGDSTVVIDGSNLSTAEEVRFGAVTLFPFVDSDSRLTVTAPPAAVPGAVMVQAITPGGPSNTLPYAYT
ncbi:IPT/TIG domain-containing protein [Streptomyces sp. LZ34]